MTRYATLGELISPAKVQRCGDRSYPVLSMTMHNGIVLQADRFKKSLASLDQSDYKVVKRGQLVVGFPIDEGVLYIQKVASEGIMSPAYNVWDVDADKIHPDYLELCLHSPQAMQYYASKLRGTTARRRSIPTADLLDLQIYLPDMEVQAKTVETIKKLDCLIADRANQLLELEQLVKSRFIELFGDTVINPLSLPVSVLEDTADIVSGITKGRKTHGAKLYEVPYMAVSNVKAGYIDWSAVKTIEATADEIEQYRLLPMDVLMTEGGDPDKLGRGAIIKNPPCNCIHQNHVFRVRVNSEVLLPEYLEEYLQHQKAKQYFLRCAKQTTGIASVNMKQIRALPLILPPLELQEQFAAFVEQTDKSKYYSSQSYIYCQQAARNYRQEWMI